MKKKLPTFVSIPEDAAALSGPYRCPDCAGITKLDPKQMEFQDLFFCPYCLQGLLIPGRPADFDRTPKTRCRKISSGNGIFVNA